MFDGIRSGGKKNMEQLKARKRHVYLIKQKAIDRKYENRFGNQQKMPFIIESPEKII